MILDKKTLSSIYDERVFEGQRWLNELIAQPPLRFDNKLRGSLPELPGVYRIVDTSASAGSTLRLGRTKTAKGGLRQRVYGNHYMGNQNGNLRAQLVRSGRCSSMEETKRYIQDNCEVQFVIIEQDDARKWAEYFLLSVLRPDFSD